jgi:predicted permease
MPFEPLLEDRPSWRRAWRLADPAYTELAFQAIYAVRQGNLPPSDRAEDLSRKARTRVLQSKLLVSALLGFLSLGSLLLLNPIAQQLFVSVMPQGLYVATVLGALVVLELTLLWWTGLQVLPAFLASGIVPLLRTLPVDSVTLRRASLLLLLRLFDAPAITCLVLTPLAAGIALHSAVAGLLLVPAVLAAVVFAISLALLSGRFFVRHIQGARGGIAQTTARWAYLVLWAVPAFAMYGFITIAPAFLRYVAGLVIDGPSSSLDLIFLAFPFPLTTLPAWGIGLSTSGAFGLDPSPVLFAALLYVAALASTGWWLSSAPLRLAVETPMATISNAAPNFRLRTGSIPAAVLRKDLRTASRTPGFAFLVLLPLLDAGALGIWTYIANPKPTDVFELAAAAVSSAALLATFFGPAFFAVEVYGYSYTRTLPLSGRSLLLGKVTLVAIIYLLSSAIVVVMTLLRIFSPGLFLAFVAAEFPAILAAAFLEFGLLFHRAERKGLPITNLFAGAWWAAAVSIPGLIVAGTPIVLYDSLKAGAGGLPAALAMGILALLELAVTVPFALSVARRGTS